jgi:hypothetical protein
MRNIAKVTLFFACLLTAAACTKDFEEVNTNNNVPAAVPPELLLSGVIRNTINDQVNEAWSIGNIVVQHTAKVQFVNEDRYLWGDRTRIWNSVYGNLRDLQNIIRSAEESEPVQNNYLGVALVLRAWMYSLVTDAYGDVPYTESLQGKQALYQPVYDSQEDVYAAILADLRTANGILGTSKEILAGDILYGGGGDAILSWRKLANSLRLRYLLRLSRKLDVNEEMAAIVNDPVAYPIFESNADHAVLEYLESPPNQWPLYNARVGSFDEFRLSKTLGDVLAAMNDPRLEVFARPTEKSVKAGAPVIAGIPNGLEDTKALDYNGGPLGVSRLGLAYACLLCNDAGEAAPLANVARGLLMTYAELQFILAEARERNMITTGDAEAYYTAGIQANVDYYAETVPASYGADLTLPAGYFTQTAVAYTGTQEEKLRKIGTQKWIALFFNGLEAWYDWRRTGIPALQPGVSNLNDDKIPVRFAYPQIEQSVNGVNWRATVTTQGEDNINTAVWWDK